MKLTEEKIRKSVSFLGRDTPNVFRFIPQVSRMYSAAE